MSRALSLGLVLSAMLVAACGVSRPSRVERSTINFVKHRIAVGGARRTNPFPATPENLRAGNPSRCRRRCRRRTCSRIPTGH